MARPNEGNEETGNLRERWRILSDHCLYYYFRIFGYRSIGTLISSIEIMPATTKESLRRQADECRRRLNLLLELKQDVVASLDQVIERSNNKMTEAEGALSTIVDDKHADAMVEKIEKTIETMKRLEGKLEMTRAVLEQSDNGDTVDARQRTLVRAADIDRSRSVSTNARSNGGGTSDRVATPNGSSNEGRSRRQEPPNGRRESPIGRQESPIGQREAMGDRVRTTTTAAAFAQRQDTTTIRSVQQAEEEASTVEIQVVEVNTTVDFSTIRPITDQQAPAANAMDYRQSIVSAGNGKNNEFCMKSVDLSAARSIPQPCNVVQVISPSLFFVRLLNNSVELIQDELYDALDAEKKGLRDPKIGDYCAAPLENDEEYHRAKILEIKPNKAGFEFAKLFYIDRGSIDWVATRGLLELPSRCRYYNRQACPCALVEIAPIDEIWTKDVVDLFRSQCAGVEFSLTSYDQGDSPEINTVSLIRSNKSAASSTNATLLVSMILGGRGKVKRVDTLVPMTVFGNESEESIGGRDAPEDTEGWRLTIHAKQTDATNRASAAGSNNQASLPSSGAISPATPSPPTETAVAVPSQAPRAQASAVVAKPTRSGHPVHPAPSLPQLMPGLVNKMSIEDLRRYENSHLYFRINELNNETTLEFYIQILNESGSNPQLDALTAGLDEFYSQRENRLILTARDQCAVYRQQLSGGGNRVHYRRVHVNNWRASPDFHDGLDIRTHSLVDVFLVDFGIKIAGVHSSEIWKLDRRFCSLSAQSVKCKLFDVFPIKSRGFEQKAVDVFKGLIHGGPIMNGMVLNDKPPFEIVAMKPEPYGGKDTCLNAALVSAGCAVCTTDFTG